jgi:hypothetical protein
MEQPWVYVVLIGLVLIVFSRIGLKTGSNTPMNASVLKDFEEVVDVFAVDMEEQNQALIKIFADTKQEYEVQIAKGTGRIEVLEKQLQELTQEVGKLNLKLTTSIERPTETYTRKAVQKKSTLIEPVSAEAEVQPVHVPAAQTETSAVRQTLKDRYSELFTYHEQGKSIEYIAKKLHMNKGEVNLIIQLSKQEERLSVQK